MLFKRLLRVRKRVVFRKLHGLVGLAEPFFGGKIYLDIKPRSLSPAQVYLHELIHVVHPNWSEKRVLATERYLWRRLTPRQRHQLYSKLFRHPYKEIEK